MHYDFIAIPDCDIPPIHAPEYGYLIHTYVSESNKTASMWKAIPEPHLDFTPHPKTNSIRTILKHQLLSESRFFREFVGTAEVDIAPLVPPDHASSPAAYLDSYIHLV